MSLTFRIVSSGTAGVTLSRSDSTRRGYNFATRTYQGLTGGDFYFSTDGTQFFANNIGQRGLVAMGACNTPVGLTPPTTGFNRFGVTATVGQCYAAESLTPTCEVIIFRVSGVSGDTIALDWTSVPEP